LLDAPTDFWASGPIVNSRDAAATRDAAPKVAQTTGEHSEEKSRSKGVRLLSGTSRSDTLAPAGTPARSATVR